MAHLSNANKIKDQLVDGGSLLQGTTDSELILHLMSRSTQKEQVDQLVDALSVCEGAFSLAVLTKDALFGVRDPNGFRPLVLGRIGQAHFLASETCAFDMIGAEYIREIFPGEVIRIDKQGCESGNFSSTFLQDKFGLSPCIFEYIYFARPDSVVFGESVHTVRLLLGRQLARECPVPVPADPSDEVVVMAVPDSSNTAALGYAKECIKLGYNCSYEIGLVRNHYVGRTFISPDQEARVLKVRCKFNPLTDVVDGKIVVLVDDSIVRGTTSKILMEMVRNAGAKEVHSRVSSPPVISPCFYGMDFPSKKELLANKFESVGMMRKYLGADSLGYLSIDGFKSAVAQSKSSYNNFCLACFTEDYPVPIDFSQNSKELMDW
jgi:amidophosphoribosyltransferase